MADKLVLTSNAPVVNGVPQVDADGAALQTISIQKQDENGNPVPGNEMLMVCVLQGAIPIIGKTPQLVNGQATFQVGPTLLSQTVAVLACNQNAMLSGILQVRFF